MNLLLEDRVVKTTSEIIKKTKIIDSLTSRNLLLKDQIAKGATTENLLLQDQVVKETSDLIHLERLKKDPNSEYIYYILRNLVSNYLSNTDEQNKQNKDKQMIFLMIFFNFIQTHFKKLLNTTNKQNIQYIEQLLYLINLKQQLILLLLTKPLDHIDINNIKLKINKILSYYDQYIKYKLFELFELFEYEYKKLDENDYSFKSLNTQTVLLKIFPEIKLHFIDKYMS
jgi:hypothetical protein